MVLEGIVDVSLMLGMVTATELPASMVAETLDAAKV